MDFVTPWLAIGELGEAADAGLRQQHGIDAVVSLLPVGFDAGQTHLKLSVADRVALPGTAIRNVTAFIERQRLAGRKTLLHCQMGISRSPALAACYLHEYAGVRLADAIHRVGRARPQADPHPALLASMTAHYDNAGKLAEPATIDLSANENPLGASPLALAALQTAIANSHRYPDRHGNALRGELARQLGGTPEQVVLGNGSCELLDLAARAFLAPGDAAIIALPCFPAYRSAVRRAHGRLIEVSLSAADNFAYRLDRISAAIDDRTRLIYLGNPNNPTGQGVAAKALDDWLASLPPQVVVVLDEAYRDYVDGVDDDGAATGDANSAASTGGAASNMPPAALADGPALIRAGRRLLVVRSFSKLHGLAGLRIGYAFGPDDLVAALEALRPTYNTNAAAQAAALAALADQAHQAASRHCAASGRQELRRELSALGLICPPSRANFVLARFDQITQRDGVDASSVAAELAAAGILVKPGAAFGLPAYLRISVGLAADHQHLVKTLGRILASPPPTQIQTEHNATQQGS